MCGERSGAQQLIISAILYVHYCIKGIRTQSSIVKISCVFLKVRKLRPTREKKKKKALKIAFAVETKHVLLFIHFFFSKRECHCSLVFQYVPAELSKGSTEVKDATVVSRICTFVPKRIDQNQRISYNLLLSQH